MATDICTHVGKRIRELRKLRKWRQIDLAVHAGISTNHVSQAELGLRELGLRRLDAIAKALDVTASYLLSSEPIKAPPSYP